MKNTITLIWLLACVALIAHGVAMADTGKFAAARVEVGNTFETRVVVLPANTVTTIASASDARPDLNCRNNSAVTIWISSAVASAAIARNMGYPILSSETFKVGANSGPLSATPDSGASEVRCADGMTR